MEGGSEALPGTIDRSVEDPAVVHQETHVHDWVQIADGYGGLQGLLAGGT
jgi:hypothetical protein